ncbi:hypothetical protein [Arthrobacter sp. MMS24-S77]
MNPWFKRSQVASLLAEAPVYFVSASTAVSATPGEIWELIKPAEKGPLLSPEVVCGFRAPDVEGLGEIQVFISARAGVEHVSALEVMEEIPQELAITRILGDEDPTARGRTVLRAGDGRTTILELGQYFSLPAEEAGNLPKYEQHYELYCRQYVERVKAFFEQSSAVAADAPWDAEQPSPPAEPPHPLAGSGG